MFMNIITKVQIQNISEEKSIGLDHPLVFKNEKIIKEQTPYHLHIEDSFKKL